MSEPADRVVVPEPREAAKLYLTSKTRRCKCGKPAMFLSRLCRNCYRKAAYRYG